MDEIADLIRLLAEAPAEEPPMTRPKELLDRVAIERAVKEGVVQPGPAVPDAAVNPFQAVKGIASQFKFSQPESKTQASPSQNPQQIGAVANPRTGIPNVEMPVKVMAPETFAGRVATPRLLDAIAGVNPTVRANETVVAVASPNPRTQVTISVPPAFPIDPKEAFSMVDEQIQLPPRQDPLSRRDIFANVQDLQLESTETLVARSFQSMEGARSELDRYVL
jgi:hypothetical protein